MNLNKIEVGKPGLYTTIQDTGRTGYQQYGMTVSGAMDTFALQVGNLLVGNERTTAGIEVVVMGPELTFKDHTVIAVTGADLTPMIDHQPIAMWKSHRIKRGQTLQFGKPSSGTYAYVTVSGGIKTSDVMGSKSTYEKAAIGGMNGRPLEKGDSIPIGEGTLESAGRILHPELIPNYEKSRPIRIIPGPDDEAFTQDGLKQFLTGTYRMSTKTDRMGAQLEGERIELADGGSRISDAVLPGTIQVPENGQPIVLFAERQPTGGYARIATVITEDIPRVAQRLPGKEVKFEAVSLTLAQQLYERRERVLKLLASYS